MRILKSMAGAIAAGTLAVSAGTAGAQTVQYTTCYYFISGGSCTPGSTTAETFVSGVNSATLTFVGQALTTVTAPTFIDFGTVAVTATTGGGFTFNGTQQVFLSILQTLPTPGGTATVAGTYSGSIIDGTSSTAIINWNSPSRFATIGSATYEVERLSAGQTSINAASTGPQTVRGFVSVTATPEPGTIALFATGLAGLIPVVIRRQRKA